MDLILQEMFPGIQFKVVDKPPDIEVAKQLAQDDRYLFQWWALSLFAPNHSAASKAARLARRAATKA